MNASAMRSNDVGDKARHWYVGVFDNGDFWKRRSKGTNVGKIEL